MASNEATAMLVSILKEHGTLKKKRLHKLFKRKNNGYHWTQKEFGMQHREGTLRSFFLRNPEIFKVKVQGKHEKAANFSVTLIKSEREQSSNESSSEDLEFIRKIANGHDEDQEALKKAVAENRKLSDINSSLKQRVDEYEEANQRMNDRLDLLNGTASADKWNTLDLHQLNGLENKLQSGIGRVQAARSKLLEQRFLCIVCLDAPKDTMIDGCNHLILCQECENKLQPKMCPICQTQYESVSKVHV